MGNFKKKKRFLLLVIGILIFVLSFLPWDAYLPSWSMMQASDWVIAGRTGKFLQADLLWGTTIRGQIWCYGKYGQNEIDFLIKDSSGNICFDLGRIPTEHKFRWNVPYNDLYSFKFDNAFSNYSKDVGFLIFSYYYFHAFLLIGTALIISGVLFIMNARARESAQKKKKKETLQQWVGDMAEKEYEEGNKLSVEYFKGSWVANSIFLPICFTLVGISYYKDLWELTGKELLPLAFASILLYLYSWAYARRYAGYSRSIWKRLQKIEEKKTMYLHSMIRDDDSARSLEWRLKHINLILFLFLLVAWGLRLYLAPL